MAMRASPSMTLLRTGLEYAALTSPMTMAGLRPSSTGVTCLRCTNEQKPYPSRLYVRRVVTGPERSCRSEAVSTGRSYDEELLRRLSCWCGEHSTRHRLC